MSLDKFHTFLGIFILFSQFIFSQTTLNSHVFVDQNESKVNVYRSNGFLNDSTDLNFENPPIEQVKDIGQLNAEEAGLIYNDVTKKLNRSILLFENDDILRYTDFLNLIITRLKELENL